jgi:hypothetical protein
MAASTKDCDIVTVNWEKVMDQPSLQSPPWWLLNKMQIECSTLKDVAEMLETYEMLPVAKDTWQTFLQRLSRYLSFTKGSPQQSVADAPKPRIIFPGIEEGTFHYIEFQVGRNVVRTGESKVEEVTESTTWTRRERLKA